MNLRDVYKAALEQRGYAQDKDYKSSRYIVMVKPDQDMKFFLGTNGALRYGTKVGDSRACSDHTKQKLHKVFKDLKANPTIESLGL